MRKHVFLQYVAVFIAIVTFVTPSLCQEIPLFKEGIEQYKEENYEEAADILEKVRRLYPKSSPAAFFLGMTYKQMMDYPKALTNFRDAVTLRPRIKQALIELIDVAVQLGKIEEAKQWIAVAERHEIYAPRMAFLTGQILVKEGKNMEAVEAFERAKSLDASLAQAADIQIALSYMKERKLKEAKERFLTAILQDPESDLATFARQYQDMVEQRIALERPLRITVGLSEQFNTNLLSNPSDPDFTSGAADQQVYSTAPSLRVNYAPSLTGPWLFTAQYALSGNLHDEYATSRDTVSTSVNMTPGYNFGTYSLNLPISYSYSLLRDPSYKEYSDSLSMGLMARKAFGGHHMIELFGGFNRKEYFQPPTREEEDKDATGYNAYISWIWIIKDIFLNLKYEYIYEDADGKWWDNEGHKFSANAVLPLFDMVKLQLSGQSYYQDYRNNHLLLSDKDRRDDETHTASVGLTWEFMKNTSMILQYTKTRVNSNIGYYEYEQGLYSTGLEYRY